MDARASASNCELYFSNVIFNGLVSVPNTTTEILDFVQNDAVLVQLNDAVLDQLNDDERCFS
jgi:hypothetical protein